MTYEYSLIKLYSSYFDIEENILKNYVSDEVLNTKFKIDNLEEILSLDTLDFYIQINKFLSVNLSVNEKKNNGIYFTSDKSSIERILSLSVFRKDNLDYIFKRKVLDPACGTGIFSLFIIDSLIKKGASKEQVISFINNNLVHIDLFKTMLEITKINLITYLYKNYKDITLLERLLPQTELLNFVYYDENNEFDLFNHDTSNYITDSLETFDIVIGNPPYVSLYGRRAKNKSEKNREYLIKKYDFIPSTIKNGKFNYSMFYIENSLKLLKPNGFLTFILDITLFENSFKLIREYILKNSMIVELDVNISAFDQVVSGQVILTLRKTKNYNNKIIINDWETGSKHTANQEDWLLNKDFSFSIKDGKISGIINKIYQKSKPLNFYFPGKSLRTSTMLLNMEHLFVKDYYPDSNSPIMPYYRGAKSLSYPFQKLKSESYYIYDVELQNHINKELQSELVALGIKNRKRIGLGDLHVFENPKLYIRQSANKLIATYEEHKSASNNSLYILSRKSNEDYDIEQLKIACAQINSELLTFVAISMNIIRKSKGKQPQIRISDLKDLPLFFDKDYNIKLLHITDCLLNNEISLKEGSKIINKIVYEYYGITPSEVQLIKNYIKDS